MEWSLHKGKRFSEFIDQLGENGAYHLQPGIPFHIFCHIFTLPCEKGPGNAMILANGKGISWIPYQTEKVDYLWRFKIAAGLWKKVWV